MIEEVAPDGYHMSVLAVEFASWILLCFESLLANWMNQFTKSGWIVWNIL